MTASSMPAALRAGAEGIYALEAATGLIIAHGTWLTRDFTCFIQPGTGTAAIDWEAAVAMLEAGGLPSSDGFTELRDVAAAQATGQPQWRTVTLSGSS